MNEHIPVGARFRERYATLRLVDGGVVVDLATGTYLRLNVTAADICAVLDDVENLADARSRIAERLHSSEESAERAIEQVIDGLRGISPRREPIGAFRYAPVSEGGYSLTSDGVLRLSMSADGASVRLVSQDKRPTAAQIFDYLRAVAPKLLFLQSTVVIHGAASQLPGGVRVISGESGAGKTTTARAFDAAGVDLLAEDMLVVSSLSPLQVYSGGEKAINAWAKRSAEYLSRDIHSSVDASELQVCCRSEAQKVSEIWFIDGARRDQSGGEILPRRLGETEGALVMMSSLFLGAASPDAWRTFLSLAGKVAASISIFEVLMPSGLQGLGAFARRYTENSAS